MDVVLKQHVDRALAFADLADGVSPWTITGIAPSLCELNIRRVQPGDAVVIKIRQKAHKNYRYNNRVGKYVKGLQKGAHLIELLPLNTLFGRVRGDTSELQTNHVQMYKRFDPAAMTVQLLLSYFNDDTKLVLRYLRKCIDCIGETGDSSKESLDPSVLLKNIQDGLTQLRFGSLNPWNRHDYKPT